ncbi:MAG: AbrB/MazE/SpoVT family DNA-binding domain-containing protein [Defluviicoccus sp.]|nr:AbrB/MazE/SpoVT family DNA-binding domain-containing protein [Defluviicoccus sp.]
MAARGRHARLFRNGRNQAVRIPREFELAADEVVIYREDRRLVIEPVERRPTLAEVLSSLEPLDEDFPEIDDPPTKPENPL